MIQNYFKIAWRNLFRSKLYSFINISGLAIGLAVCMIIILYVGHESTYDRFHKNADRIVWTQGRVKMGNDSMFLPFTSYGTAPLAKQASPFIESFVRLKKETDDVIIQNKAKPVAKFSETNFLYADSNFFNFFSFNLLSGRKGSVLEKPFSIVISKKMAEKYFGSSNPIGKILRFNSKYDFIVTGVADKAPSNSTITYDFIASLTTLPLMDETKKLTELPKVQLGSFSTYFLLKESKDAPKLEASLLQLSKSANKDGKTNERYIATPITKSHLEANYNDFSNVKYLKVFPFVAVLILILALINYISLSTAKSSIRSKEIGVRKVLGANRKTIATQFFVESAVYISFSFVLAYFLCIAFQSHFFRYLQLDIDNSFLYSPSMLFALFILFILTVIVAATYPSFVLSAYRPIMILHRKVLKNQSGLSIRKFFTIFQFTISIALIVCGIVIDRQMYFFRNTDTGVNRQNVIMIPFNKTIGQHYNAFKKDIQSFGFIAQTATANYPMYKGVNMFFTKAKGSDEDVALPLLTVDNEFTSLMGLKWKLKPEGNINVVNGVFLNEKAVEKLNLGKSPLNQNFTMGNQQFTVTGILKNFNYASMENSIDALCLIQANENDSVSAWQQNGGCLFAKIAPHVNTQTVIEHLKSVYEKYDTETPFEYNFMDEAFDAMYKAENRLARILEMFTAFTLFIACLGLFGLSTFMALQRTKEVGIRKVLGASVAQVTILLSKDFIKLVVVAIIIASPVAWWAMNKWLQGFVYRINITWWMFAIAMATAIIIALITVSFQAIKAALANPVKSLRTE